MSRSYYRLLLAFGASLCLLTASCGSDKSDEVASQGAAQKPPPTPDPGGIDTESTIWTIFGLAKKPSETANGPHLGPNVSPSLWRAAHDALSFVKIASEDLDTGMLETDWYSPPGKPNERLRVSVFVLSVALRTDSLAVSVDREVRAPTGQWQKSTVDRLVVDNLESTILLRARHLHAEQYRSTL